MKKNEMISIIDDLLWQNDVENHANLCIDIFEAIVKAGMIPPSIELHIAGKTYRDNCWEPEDG